MATNVQKQGYEVDGQVAKSLKELANLLGVDKITKKDIENGGEYSDVVSLIDLSDEEWENTTRKTGSDDTHPMEVDKSKVYSTISEEVTLTPAEVTESMPDFAELDELKEFIKDIDTQTLEYLAKGLQLEWKETYHANIHRMRIAMEMQKHFFPELFVPKDAKKKKGKYGDLTTEQLFSKAKELKIDYKESGNESIDRMRVIMALKNSGHLAD